MSQPRPESFRYSLEGEFPVRSVACMSNSFVVTRVDVNDIRKRSKKGRLYLEIKIGNAHYKRVDIGSDGQITSDATLLL